MYNVIFVDDEEESILRAKEVIESCGGGSFQLCETFDNGFLALDYLEDNKNIDLVITDISMPYLNGVELAKKIYDSFPRIKVIFLSGYDKIDYAKDAIRYGVVDYITKPLSYNNMRGALEKVKNILDEQKMRDTSNEELVNYEKESLPVIKEGFVLNLISKDIDEKAFLKRALKFHMNLDFPYFMVGLIRTTKGDTLESKLIYLRKYVNDEAADYNINLDTLMLEDNIVVLFKFVSTNESLIIAERVMEGCRLKFQRYFGEEIEAGISNVVTGLSKVRLAYHQAQHALYQKGITSQEQIKFYSSISNASDVELLDEHELTKFKYAVRYLSLQDAIDALKTLFVKVNAAHQLNEIYYYATNILNVIINSSSNVKHIYDRYLPNTIYDVVLKIIDTNKLYNFFVDLLTFVQEDNNKMRLNQVSSSLKIITDYISLNFVDVNLSLKTVAEKTGYSTSYICMIFKKELNTTFVKYLTQLRMEKAKELLSNSQLLIVDICPLCGYQDPYYFSSTFKKYSGLSPRGFREKLNK